MAYNPDTDPKVIALRKRFPEAEAEARAKADGYMKDDALARAKGKSPEQIEARKRVAALFCQLHLPHDPPPAIQTLLDSIDYEMTVTTTNARPIDLDNIKGTGFLGFGRKPTYLLSKHVLPKTPDDPLYALEYFTLAP